MDTLTPSDLRRWANACRSGLFPLLRSSQLVAWQGGRMLLHPIGILPVVRDPHRFPDWPVGWDRRLEDELETELDRLGREDHDILGAVDHFWRGSARQPSVDELARMIEREARKLARKRYAEIARFVLAVLLGLGLFWVGWVVLP